MAGPTSDLSIPVLLSATPGWDPMDHLTIERTASTDGVTTLGLVGPIVAVVGPERFPPTVLRIPISQEDLSGVDPYTLRIFRLEPGTAESSPLWASGLARGLGYAWAKITAPGRYFAVGLPRDPILRERLEVLGRALALAPISTNEERRALFQSLVVEPLERTPPEWLQALREAAAADELATSPDPGSLVGVPRTGGGGVGPIPLPQHATVDQYLTAARRVAAASDSLPEQTLLAAALPDRVRPRVDLAAVAAAPANWWMFHGDPEHSGVVTESHLSTMTIGMLRPRRRLVLDGPIVSVPAVVDGTIYVGVANSSLAAAGRGGSLYAIDLLSGVIRSRFTFNTPQFGGARQGLAGIACTPAVANGRVYFSGQDGKLYCLNAFTLAPIWVTDMRHADPLHHQPVTHQVAAEGWCSPLLVDDRLYVGWGENESNAFGFLYCLDARTGDVLWLFCTTLFPGVDENQPNVLPRSAVGLFPLPAQFRVAPDPVFRGGSPWSSCAFDAASGRVIVGTGNVLPQNPLPQPPYSLSVLSVDAVTGGSPRFFQPSNLDNYRPDDDDCDIAASPMVFSRGRQRVVAVGSKNGSFFLLDAATMAPLARRQLLPRIGGNGGFPGDKGRAVRNIDPHPLQPNGERRTENFYGTFSCPAAHAGLQRIFVGLGGFAFGVGTPGIDSVSTPFLRALNWTDLTDAWTTVEGPDRVHRYVTPRPPMYSTPGEAGFSSPVVVNDLVFVSTTRPALYCFDADTGLAVWSAPGFGPPIPNSYTLGPAIYGDFLVVGSPNVGLLIYSL
jgi:outer membrane protein assembly factor BamB